MLESLKGSKFMPLALNEAATVLGGQAVPIEDGGGDTFNDCYTFFKDGTYRSDDKDQD